LSGVSFLSVIDVVSISTHAVLFALDVPRLYI
jgi:hypothetical protein